jgi:hypothetical protein
VLAVNQHSKADLYVVLHGSASRVALHYCCTSGFAQHAHCESILAIAGDRTLAERGVEDEGQHRAALGVRFNVGPGTAVASPGTGCRPGEGETAPKRRSLHMQRGLARQAKDDADA